MTQDNDNAITPVQSNDYDFRYHEDLLAECPFDALMNKHAYDEFVGTFDDVSDLTYEQWYDYLDKMDKEHDTDPNTKLDAFVPPPGFGKLGAGIASGLAGQAFGIGADATIDDFVNKGAEFLREQVRERRRTADMSGSWTDPAPDQGDGGTTEANYAGGSSFNPTGLSLNLKPVDINFSTDIVPLYRPKFFLDGRDSTAPLIMKTKCVYPERSTSSDLNVYGGSPDLQDYLWNKVMADWVNLISRKVRLNTFTSGILTWEYVSNYYASIAYCLSVLYFYLSVEAHFTLEKNRNEGMITLYQTFSVSDLNKIRILRQVLDEVPLDPMVNQHMFHLYDNYKQSHLPGAPLLKYTPIKMVPTLSNENHFNGLESGILDKCLLLLRNKKFRDFQQLYVQAFPTSVETKTYSYSGMPKFDANWLTSFVNSEKMSSTSAVGYRIMPNVASDSETIKMNMHTDAPDGWIDASNSIYDTTMAKYRGGFGATKKVTINSDDEFYGSVSNTSEYFETINRYTSSYIYVEDMTNAGSTIRGFFPLEKRERYVVLSGDTWNGHISTSVTSKFQRFGTETALPLTIRDSVPIAMQFADLMYTPWKFGSSSSKVSGMSEPSLETKTEEGSTNRRRRPRRKRK